MIPYIKYLNKSSLLRKTYSCKWLVVGNHSSSLVITFVNAIRFWLWHCGIPMKHLIKK